MPAELAAAVNSYLRSIDACDSVGSYDVVDDLLLEATRALATPATASLQALPSTVPTLPKFSSDTARARYMADYPTVPPFKNRLLAALLWRRARNCMKQGSWALSRKSPASASTVEHVRQLFELGLHAARDSLAQHESDADAHKYAGILAARSAKDTRETIANAYRIRDHTLRAIALRPRDPVLQHIMGVWCFEVASLSWVMRQVASALFGSPPTSSYEEALKHLLRSEELGVVPGGVGPMMGTRLKIAQVYDAMGRREEAKTWLRRCLEVPFAVGEDESDIALSRDLAKKLGVPLPAQSTA